VGGRSPFAFVLVVILDLRGLWGVAEWGASIFFFRSAAPPQGAWNSSCSLPLRSRSWTT